MVDDESILRLARLLGASFSRIAEAQVAVVEQLASTDVPRAQAPRSREIERTATAKLNTDTGPSALHTPTRRLDALS